LLEGYLNTALRLSFADELDIILFDKLLFTAVLFKLRNLLLLRLIVGDLLLEVLHLIIAILKEDLFLFVFLSKLHQLIRIFVLRSTGFTSLVHHDD
jgi:hypothetical protein